PPADRVLEIPERNPGRGDGEEGDVPDGDRCEIEEGGPEGEPHRIGALPAEDERRRGESRERRRSLEVPAPEIDAERASELCDRGAQNAARTDLLEKKKRKVGAAVQVGVDPACRRRERGDGRQAPPHSLGTPPAVPLCAAPSARNKESVGERSPRGRPRAHRAEDQKRLRRPPRARPG